jgi:hypothetical protein
MKKHSPITWILIGVFLSIGVDIIYNVRTSQSRRNEQSVLAQIDHKTITVMEFEKHFYDLPLASQHEYVSQTGRRILLRLLAGDALLSQEKLLGHQVPAFHVSEAEVRRFYNFHRKEYDESVVIDAARIIFSTAEEAELAQNRLAQGIAFADMAKSMPRELVREPTFFVASGELSLDYRVLCMMRPGQISGTIPKDQHFEILQLHSITPATLDRLAAWIEETVRSQKLVQWLDRRPQKDRVTLDENLLASLRLQTR